MKIYIDFYGYEYMIYSLMETVWSASTKKGNCWSLTVSSVESLSESMVKANPLAEVSEERTRVG